MMQPTDLNRPDIVAEVTRLFLDYEAALMRNDVEALNAYFWDHGAVTRYGIADRQWGHSALVAHRKTVPPPDFTRTLHDVRVTTFGPDMAVAMTNTCVMRQLPMCAARSASGMYSAKPLSAMS